MKKLIISGTFVVEPVKDTINFWNSKFSRPLELFIAPYNQLFHQLSDTKGEFAKNKNGINLIIFRPSDLNYREDNILLLIESLKLNMKMTEASLYACLCPDADLSKSHLPFNISLQQALKKVDGLNLITCDEIYTLCPRGEAFDDLSHKLADIPYTNKFYCALGTLIARRLYTHCRLPYKVIALDCDNTLWKGVCGEETLNGIKISAPHTYFQQLLLSQHEKGVLLCLLSKNVEDDVIHVFNNHSHMHLKIDHITARYINWRPKSANMKALARELNIGLENIIFIDDNPIECAEMKSHCPEVLTLQMATDEEKIIPFLNTIWDFDHHTSTNEDLKRATFYKENVEREKERLKSSSFKEFIDKLELNIIIRTPTLSDHIRLSQLTTRTNQFNFTTVRQCEADFAKLPNERIRCISAEDRFGDYGIIGVIIFNCDDNTLDVETFLLSCRILGRGIEHHIVRHLGEIARKEECERVRFTYIPTKKNLPALQFLKTLKGAKVVHNEENVTFTISAKEASNVLFNAEEVIASEPFLGLKQNEATTIEKSFKLAELTTKLQTIEQILEAVEGQSQKLRPPLNVSCKPSKIALQQQLIEIWEVVLKVSPIGIEDNFHYLGGTSLQAVQMIARLHKLCGIELSFTEIIENPTIEMLTHALINKQNEHTTPKFQAITKGGERKEAPLSYAQIRLWLSDMLFDAKAAYNVPLAFYFNGNVDEVTFFRALNSVMNCNLSLKTYFTVDSLRGVLQNIDAKATFPFKKIDLKGHAYCVDELIKNEALTPFDLSKAPLIRGILYDLNDNVSLFIMTLHHIIVDEASLEILFNEVNATYAALAKGIEPENKSHDFDYIDFAVWQREWLERGHLDKQLSYWQQKLEGTHGSLNLPTARPRPEVPTYQCHTYTHKISSALHSSIKKVAASSEVTLFATLLAAFQVLLHRYTDQDEVLVGVPISNRHYPGTSELIGFFVNLLPIFVSFQDNIPFTDHISRLRTTLQEAYENQDCPFEKIVDTLKAKRELNCHPLIQVAFLQRNQKGLFQFDGVSVERLQIPFSLSPFDLTVIAEETENGLEMQYQYSCDLFSEEQIASMACHFEELLKGITINPNEKIGHLPLLTAREIDNHIQKIQASTKNRPSTTIHARFEQQANKYPSKEAIVFEDEYWTYSALNERSNQIANVLHEKGVASHDIIGVHMLPCPDLIASLLAILKVGAAFLPLDPSYPAKYIQYALESAQAKIVLCKGAHEVSNQIFQGIKINLDAIKADPTQKEVCNFQVTSRPEDLAYILFTSGSSGTPKGVMIEHKNVCHLADSLSKSFYIDSKSRMLQFSSLSFDASIAEIFPTLLNGGTLIMLSKEDRLSPENLASILERNKASIAIFPPSYLATLPENCNINSLETIVVGGEVCKKSVAKRFFKNVRLINGYGPTEITVIATAYTYEAPFDLPETTIGRPIENAFICILDRYKNLVPEGVQGEIYIGGMGLARGYLNQPQHTKEQFIEIKLGSTLEFRLYRSFDLGRQLPSGEIDFLGRCDSQVKLNGYRIELQHIEVQLSQCEGIKNGVVLLREDRPGIKQLVAYITIKEDLYSLQSIKSEIKKRLPSYMVPDAFEVLDDFPLLSNGKIDKAKLLPPFKSQASKNQYERPTTLTEKRLLTLWEDILQMQGLSPFDNFFDVGGNSLLAIQMLTTFSKIFNYSLSPATFYADPTVNAIAKTVSGHAREVELLKIREGSIKPTLFLIHPSTGTSLCYLGLKEQLSERGIYGVCNPYMGLNHFKSLAEMASHYVKIMMKNPLPQSFYLGGWCFGGVVAFEMAQQLKTLGIDVPLILLIDSYLCRKNNSPQDEDNLFINQGVHPLDDETSHNIKLLKEYTPHPYTGTATILKAENPLSIDPTHGWEEIILNPMKVYSLKGKHVDLFSGHHLESTALQIQKCMDDHDGL